MNQKTCCFTGHRQLTWEQTAAAALKIMEEVMQAAADGYTRFITGLAEGADQLFAENVLMLKKYSPDLDLVAAISHRGRLNARDGNFQRLLKLCTEVVVLSESYWPSVYDRRNRWMVDESTRLIAACDGRKAGGTYRTLSYAQKHGTEIRLVDLSEAALGKYRG